MKKSILFLCTHNSARSQLAQGLVNHHFGDRWEAHSAGTEETEVKPEAVQVLSEVGIDITNHRSKTVEVYRNRQFDVVVTVCDSARETCPFFPGRKVVHHSFEDPSGVTGAGRLDAFRKTRNEILEWLEAALPVFAAEV